MAVQLGTIWAQEVVYSSVAGGVHTIHMAPNHRDITTNSAISLIVTGGTNWAETGIVQIVSNGINETFDPPRPVIQRSNVTEMTFRTASTGNRVYARHVVYYGN